MRIKKYRSPIEKKKLVRKIAGGSMLLALVVFLAIQAYAAYINIDTVNGTNYFQEYNGDWNNDQQTPRHFVSGTGQVAYCLAEKRTTPSSNTSYGTADAMGSLGSYNALYNDPNVQNGLQIILERGYPLNGIPTGLTADEAQYATANAIRYFLAENGGAAAGLFYNNENLGGYNDAQLRSLAASGTIGSKQKAKSGYTDVLQYCIELLIAARNGGEIDHSVGFSLGDLTLSYNGYGSYTGTVSVTSNNNSRYELSGDASRYVVGGYTGNSGDLLTLSIPADGSTNGLALGMSAQGFALNSDANVYVIKPASGTTYQPIMTFNTGTPYQVVGALAGTTIRTPLPDLTPCELWTTDIYGNRKDIFDPGETIKIHCAVQNQQGGVSGGNYTRISTAGGYGDYGTNAFAPWGYQYFDITRVAPSNYGSLTTESVSADADVYGQIGESNKGNNHAAVSYQVKPGLPNLYLSASTNKALYDPGEAIYVTVTEHNNGPGSAVAHENPLVGRQFLSIPTHGAYTDYTYTYGPFYAPNNLSTTTTFTETIIADYWGQVGESNENDNQTTVSYQVKPGPPNLKMLSLTAGKAVYNPGETVTMTASIQNTGYTTATNAVIRLTGNNGVPQQDIQVTISAGATTQVQYQFTAQTYTTVTTLSMTATADPANAIAESNEADNTVNGSTRINTKPSATASVAPDTVSDELGDANATVTVKDPDGDSMETTIKLYRIGIDKPGPNGDDFIETYVDRQSFANNTTWTKHLTGLIPGNYRLEVSVKDPYGLSYTANYSFNTEITNVPPTVSITPDKSFYYEGDTAHISVRVYDRKGDALDVTLTFQDLGELGQNHQPVEAPITRHYDDTLKYRIAQDQTFVVNRVPMLPHPLKVHAHVVDSGGMYADAEVIIQTLPRPIDGQVVHMPQWEINRQDYNLWATRTNRTEKVRPPELFFRGERFVLQAQTSQYLRSNYVQVQIAEHPEYNTLLTSTDGYNWTGYLWGAEMFEWPSQSLTFIFQNQYIDGTVTSDTVVVRIDKEDYYKIRMTY